MELHDLSADRPIESASNDRLGREPFSHALAGAIAGWRGKDSLVIALNGPWGCGKTSVKNMACENLRAMKQAPIVAEFNPWNWAGQNRIFEAFFGELAAAIGKSAGNEGREAAKRLNRLGDYLRFGGSAARAVGGMASMLTAGFSGPIGDALAQALRKAAEIAEQGAKVAHGQESAGERDVAEIKEQVAESLGSLAAPVLVVIDDIDRLASEEIRIVFQLIKSNADLPNVVCLLLFERLRVERCLEEVGGPGFLDKIVQVRIDVPDPGRNKLAPILEEAIAQAFTREEQEKHFRYTEWGNRFVGGVWPLFDNLRDVYRFQSSLAFHCALLRERGVLNVNPVDLVCLESLRVQQPRVYDELVGMKELLLRPHDGRWAKSGDEELEQLFGRASDGCRGAVCELIKRLFPRVGWFLANQGEGQGFTDRWAQEMRVCSEQFFDRYFQLQVPEDELAEWEFTALREALADRDRGRTALLDLARRGLFKAAISRLRCFEEQLPRSSLPALIGAVVDVGDDIPAGSAGFFGLPAWHQAFALVHKALDTVNSAEERSRILREAIQSGKGLMMPLALARAEVRHREKGDDKYLLDPDFAEVRAHCASLIAEFADSGNLLSHRYASELLYAWRDVAGEDSVQAWMKSRIADAPSALQLLGALLIERSGVGLGDHVSETDYFLSLEGVEALIPVVHLESLLQDAEQRDLGHTEQAALQAFREALAGQRSGPTE